MFIDASALAAILIDEDDAKVLAARLEQVSIRITSPLAVWEAVVAVARERDLSISDARIAVEGYLRMADIDVAPIGPEAAGIAIGAFERYGKGRHPARLNFGDCFAYACARLARLPMLYKGGDFALTDIEAG